MRATGCALAALAITGTIEAAAAAADNSGNYVDLQLVLAVDVSGSMDYTEQRVQRDGYAQAFKDPEVIDAILSGPYGRIAVTYVQWAGAFFQEATVPWTIIASKDDAFAFSNALTNAPIFSERGTSLSGALSFSASAFDLSNVESDRMTIDVSGDGSNNDGAPLTPVRDKVVQQGVTINGLPIVINPSGVPGAFAYVGLDDYYHDCVIGGPGSFVIPIKSNTEFAPAIRRKLILEIASGEPAVTPASQATPAPKIDCAAADRVRGYFFTP